MAGLPEHLTVKDVNIHGPIAVFLDGVAVADVCEAHTQEGWLVRVKRDESGNFCVGGDEFVTEKLFGTVTARVVE